MFFLCIFLFCLQSISANTIGSYGGNALGKAHLEGLDEITHKLGHAALGAVQGLIFDYRRGALPGALGGMVGETAAEALHTQGLSPDNAADLGRLTAATTALFTNQHIPLTLSTATNAVENNFLRHTLPQTKKELDEAIEGFKITANWATTEIGKPGLTPLEIALSLPTGGESLLVTQSLKAGVKFIFKKSFTPFLPQKPTLLLQLEKPLQNTKSLALSAPAMVKHHIFNKFRGQSFQSQKYRDFFKNHGIDVDAYTVEIPRTMHVNKIHTANNNWTTKWKEWIDKNPNASTKEVYQFGGQLMDEYKINGLTLKPYR